MLCNFNGALGVSTHQRYRRHNGALWWGRYNERYINSPEMYEVLEVGQGIIYGGVLWWGITYILYINWPEMYELLEVGRGIMVGCYDGILYITWPEMYEISQVWHIYGGVLWWGIIYILYINWPEMYEVSEVGRGVVAGTAVDGNVKGALTQERLRVGGHVWQVVHDDKHLDHRLVWVEQRLSQNIHFIHRHSS